MARDRSQIGVKITRVSIVSIKICYRSVCDHPFLVGMMCFLIFLYRTSPFVFSLLVSASPVFVCTAALLGTLLSFGQPNIPEIEEEPEITHETASFKTEVARDATVVERDETFNVERFMRVKKDIVEDSNEEAARLVESQASEVEEDARYVDYRPLVDESPHEIQPGIRQVRFEERGFDLEVEKEREIVEEKPIEDNWNHMMADEHQVKDRGSFEDKIDDSKGDQMDTSPVSPWTPMRHDEDDEDDADRDDSLDSGSDGAESSSPDASMTDIIPMLDELHPLLDSEAPQPANISREGSDAASEGPHRSSDEGIESDIESEDHGEEGDNENDDEEEDEGETKGDKEDESKSAIKWTEVDQKNLMDLGTSELERNQRLENLIARRRACKNMRLMAERNLIDLDSSDVPFNMPHISIARRNPFDVPYDSYDDMGLPPIPGSAPSVLLPRRNPFDLPYEPNEEKPDLKGDSILEEFSDLPQKEAVFRRHESFNVGTSTFGGPRQDRHDVRFRPFFVLERLANEGTSSYSFERQLSELSESKVSSIPDTESVSTVLEEEDKKVIEQDIDRESELMFHVDPASGHDDQKSLSSEDVDSVGFDEQADNRNIRRDVAEIILGGAESHQYEQLNMSEALEAHDNRVPGENNYSDSESSLSDVEEKIPEVTKEEVSTSLEPRVALVEESGVSPRPSFEEPETHSASGVEDDYQNKEPAKESFISAQPLLEESETQVSSEVEVDHHHREPVYDSSPPSGKRFLSFPSVSSDNQGQIPETGVQSLVESPDKEPEAYSESRDNTTSGFEEIHTASAVHSCDEYESRPRGALETSEYDVQEEIQSASVVHASDEYESRPRGAVETSEYDAREGGLLGSDTTTVVSEYVLEHFSSVDSSSPPLDKDDKAYLQQDQVHSSVSGLKILENFAEDVEEAVAPGASSNSMASEDLALPTREEAVSEELDEHVFTLQTCTATLDNEHIGHEHETDPQDTLEVLEEITETSRDAVRLEQGQLLSPTFNTDIQVDSYSTLSSGAVEYVEAHSFNDDDIPQSEQDHAQLSNSNGNVDTDLEQAMDVEVVSVNAVGQDISSEVATPSELGKEPAWSDKSMVEPSMSDHHEPQEPSVTQTGRVGVTFARNVTFHEYHDAEDTTNLSCLSSDSTSPSPSPSPESPEYETPMVGEGRRVEFFDDPMYEALDRVSEQLDQSTELHDSHIPREINEDADEIKEIDEGLLFELDTVGDFSVKEIVTDSEPESSGRDSNLLEGRTEELPVLEARSVEDINSAFQQIHEGTEIGEVILPSSIQDQLAETSGEIKSNIALVEARSLEDIDTALKQVSEEHVDEIPKSPDSEDGSALIKCPVGVLSEVLIEERSLDETHSSFKGGSEEGEVKDTAETTADSLTVETRSLDENPELSGVRDGPTEISESMDYVEEAEASNLSLSTPHRGTVVDDNQKLGSEEMKAENLSVEEAESSSIKPSVQEGSTVIAGEQKLGSEEMKAENLSIYEAESSNVKPIVQERSTIIAGEQKHRSEEIKAEKVVPIEEAESSNVKSGLGETSSVVADEQKLGSEEVKSENGFSIEEGESSNVKSNKQDESTIAADKQKLGFQDISENSGLSSSHKKDDEKAKASSSSSDSSSSSSSSDSE